MSIDPVKDAPRRQHYYFAHQYLRERAEQNPKLLVSTLREKSGTYYLGFHWGLTAIALKDQVDEDIPADGLECFPVEIDDEYYGVLVQFPEPKKMTEAYFVAILIPISEGDSAPAEFFTLEFSLNDNRSQRTVLGEWKGGSHFNYGDGPPPEKEAFLDAIRRLVLNRAKKAGLQIAARNWEIMTRQEIHEFGIKAILPYLEEEGVTIEQVNSDLRMNPQIIGKRWGSPAFIAIRTSCYPNKGELTADEHAQLMNWADKHGAAAFFASVGIVCISYPDKTDTIERDMCLPIRNGGFNISYAGLVVVTTSDRVQLSAINQAPIDEGIALMKRQRFDEALPLFHRALDQDPSQWNVWYMAGQCCRFLNDIEGAIERLSRAVKLKGDEPAVFLALGIAFQMDAQWDQAIEAFSRAIEIDADYELAYNSLALTQKKRGDLDKALHNYDAGAKALGRRLVKGLENSRTSPILKHRDTRGTLWLEYAMYAAIYLANSAQGISGIAWPTAEQALEEERSERHAGLYWVDLPDGKGETMRLFLPNYFNTFCELLRGDASFSNLIGNRGTVLELLGRRDEARLHFEEAAEFHPQM